MKLEVLNIARRLMEIEQQMMSGTSSSAQALNMGYADITLASGASTSHLAGKPLDVQFEAYLEMGKKLYQMAKIEILVQAVATLSLKPESY